MTHHKPIETCHLAFDEDDSLISKLMADEHSYIHEHLATLTLLTQLERPNAILEIGTGRGDSTIAFADACLINGHGHIFTVDIKEAKEAKKALKDSYVESAVTFIQGDSLKIPIDGQFDIIFIDGLHTYKQVKAEIEKFVKMLSSSGMMIFHDTYNPAHPGVKKAVDEFINHKWDKWDMIEYFNCNGLTILRKKDPLWSS